MWRYVNPRTTDLLDIQLAEVEGVRDRPYFGRIDYSVVWEKEIRTIHIGDLKVAHEDPRYPMVSRSASVARLDYRPVDGLCEMEE